MHIEIPKMVRVDRNSILGWLVVKGLVVAVVWRVATKQRKANRFLDVADGVGWFYASNRTLDDVAGICAPQVCVAGSMLSNV